MGTLASAAYAILPIHLVHMQQKCLGLYARWWEMTNFVIREHPESEVFHYGRVSYASIY